MEVFVKTLYQPELMKWLGLRSSEVKICYELTGNDFLEGYSEIRLLEKLSDRGVVVGWMGGF